jgi:hypothetical protein
LNRNGTSCRLKLVTTPITDATTVASNARQCRPTGFRGHEYVMNDVKGYRTVSWTEGQVLFSLVSALDYDALLECADHLRVERAGHNRP